MEPCWDSGKAPVCSANEQNYNVQVSDSPEEGKTHCFKALLFLKLKSSYKKLRFEIGRVSKEKWNRA